ncbi:cyclin-dependent protein kinase [Savitreella phatthalungensis]
MMQPYLRRKEAGRSRVLDRYVILGFIASGTYGKVYKAKSKYLEVKEEYAIKKFKPEREGEAAQQYTGLSQSAIREMSLCREIRHDNIVHLHDVILEDKCIFMVFEYAEHDLLQIIHYHSHHEKDKGLKRRIPDLTVRSIIAQLLAGVAYLHENWIMHRDLKPANIMIDVHGQVKIGDLGLARVFRNPLQSLYLGDKVVVTIWYRAPELVLGAKHYTPAIDLWAIGCIFAELLVLKPLFKGDEMKMDNKTKTIPFQRQQMGKIMDILGVPTSKVWPGVEHMPEFNQLRTYRSQNFTNNLPTWWQGIGCQATSSPHGLSLLSKLLEYDPSKRITARTALDSHPFFDDMPQHSKTNAFEGSGLVYPHRQIRAEDSDLSSMHKQQNSVLIQATKHGVTGSAVATAKHTHSNASSVAAVAAMAAAVKSTSAQQPRDYQQLQTQYYSHRPPLGSQPTKRRPQDELDAGLSKRLMH